MRCALVTGVQTCALPILRDKVTPDQKRLLIEAVYDLQSGRYPSAYAANSQSAYHLYMKEVFAEILSNLNVDEVLDCGIGEATSWLRQGRDAEIGRASCRERVCQYV